MESTKETIPALEYMMIVLAQLGICACGFGLGKLKEWCSGQSSAKQSLKSMTHSLIADFLAISVSNVPILGPFLAGYLVAGFDPVVGQKIFPFFKIFPLFLYLAMNIGFVLDACNPQVWVEAEKLNSCSYRFILSHIFVPTVDQIGFMVIQLASKLLAAQRHVEKKKEQLQGSNYTPTPEESLHFNSMPIPMDLVLHLVAVTAVAIDIGSIVQQSTACGESTIYRLEILIIFGAQEVIRYLSFLQIARFMLHQVKLVHKNMKALNEFVERSFPFQLPSDELFEIHESLPGSTETTPMSGSTEPTPIPDMEPMCNLQVGQAHWEAGPILVTSRDGMKAWWAEWHFLRTSCLYEQFGLDAQLGLCGVNILTFAAYLFLFWLFSDEVAADIQFALTNGPILWTFLWSYAFAYISWCCIKVNDTWKSLLVRIDCLISREWCENGYQNIAMLKDFKASVETEGPPHTFFGQPLSWGLMLGAFVPLLTAAIPKLWPILQEVRQGGRGGLDDAFNYFQYTLLHVRNSFRHNDSNATVIH